MFINLSLSQTKLSKKSAAVALTLLGFNALATQMPPKNVFWNTRVTSQGLLGRGQISGFVDSMVPMLGDNNHLWFVDGSIMGGNPDAYAASNSAYSIGTGVRQLHNFSYGKAVLGGFLFADYQQTAHRTKAWIANPGIELLGTRHEARVQGYIPLSKRNQAYQTLMATAIPHNALNDSINSRQLGYVQGHSFYDTPGRLADEYGVGIEAEVGQYLSLPSGGWLRGGGYYFNYRNAKNITGVEANIELFMGKHAALIVQDNYDNQNKNKISLGIRFNFGGPDHTQVNTIANRMEEPIIRHIARQSYGLATPTRDVFIPTGPTQLIADNIWFFSPTGTYQGHGGGEFTLDMCTAENPCNNLDQTIADAIASVSSQGFAITPPPQTSLWFAPGNYTLPSTGTDGFIQLYEGQSLWGRTANFFAPASFNQLPTIHGALWWNGNGFINNMETINKDQIIPQAVSNAFGDAIIGIGAAENLTINNSKITASATSGTAIFGAYSNMSDITLNSSHISAIADVNYTGFVDTLVADTGNIFVNKSTVDANGIGTNQHNAILGANDIIVNDSIIHVSGSTNADPDIGGSNGVFAFGNTTIKNSEVTVTDSIGYANGVGAGVDVFISNSVIHAYSASSSVVGVSPANNSYINNSEINVISTGAGSAHGVEGANATITNSWINARSSGSDSYGVVDLSGLNTVTVKNSFISAINTGNNPAVGISAGTIIFNGTRASHVSANSSGVADAVNGTVTNNSTPKSQCTVNNSGESDCA